MRYLFFASPGFKLASFCMLTLVMGRIDPWVGSGRVGSGWVPSGPDFFLAQWVESGPTGSDCAIVAACYANKI